MKGTTYKHIAFLLTTAIVFAGSFAFCQVEGDASPIYDERYLHPAYLKELGDNEFWAYGSFTKHFDFLSLSNFYFDYEYISNGKLIQMGKFGCNNILTGTFSTIMLPFLQHFDTIPSEICLNICAKLNSETLWEKEGCCFAREQFIIEPNKGLHWSTVNKKS